MAQSRELSEFQILSRTIFGILRTHYHQNKVQNTIQGSRSSLPKLIGTQRWLSGAIQPSTPSANTALFLQGNSLNWLHTGLQITEDHYIKTITTLLFKVQNISAEKNQEAWDVACKWARAKYPHIQREIFTQTAEDLVFMGFQITPQELALSKSCTEVPHKSQTNTKYNLINPPTITQPLVVDTSPPTAELVSQIHPQRTTENVVSQDTNLSPVLALTIKNPLIRTNITGKQLWRTKPTDPTPLPGPSKEVICEESHLSPSPPAPPMECFRRHEHRGNKKSNWSLTPKREVIIMGASNISRLPLIQNLKIQVDSFPGANMAQATHLIKRKTPTSPETKIVLLCFGLNDRNTVKPETLNHDLQDLLSAAHNTFPNAKIHVPLINVSMRLPIKAYRNITLLNAAIKRIPGYLEKMDMRDYVTADDNIHWTPKTAHLMWKNWRSSLDL